ELALLSKVHLLTRRGPAAAHPQGVRRASAEPFLMVCSMHGVACFAHLATLRVMRCAVASESRGASGSVAPASVEPTTHQVAQHARAAEPQTGRRQNHARQRRNM